MTLSDTPCSSITYDQLSDNSIGVIYNRNIFIKTGHRKSVGNYSLEKRRGRSQKYIRRKFTRSFMEPNQLYCLAIRSE
jgi:hypothetical protein